MADPDPAGSSPARDWLDESLAGAGIVRTGAVTRAYVRPWGTVLTAPTSHGPVWLKAPGADTAFEVALYPLLARLAPDHVLTPIAVDVPRGLLLLPDGGRPLGEEGLAEALVTILPAYGRLQRDLIPHVGDLLAYGVTDMRAAVMPRRFDEAVEAARRYADRHGDEDGRETCRRVAALRDTFTGWCERLGEAAVAPSLDHGDLHAWNILAGRRGTVFYDWGDSVVAHPFASMLVTLGFLGDAPAPVVRRVRDSYLEPFADLAPHADLVEELELACRVGKISRVLTWERAVRHDETSEYASAPLQSLSALLSDSPTALTL